LTAGDDPLLCTEENKSISWIFSVSPNLGSEIKALFQGLTTLDLEPIAPLLADDVTGNKISLWIQGYGLEYHLRILPFQNFGLHDTDVIAQLDHFKGQGARVIVVWGPRNCASMLLHSAMTTGINMVVPVQLITSDMLKKYNGSIRLLTAAPPLLLGRHISLSHPCSFAVHRFIKAMEKEVSEFSVEQFLAGGKAWDAVHLAVMGVRESKTARGSDLGEALENLDQGYYGVMGIFKPTKSDHSGLLPHSLVVVERGKNSWIPVISSNR
jgi:ABC-type branched-subunit amino acid transport system substrate-binding protein